MIMNPHELHLFASHFGTYEVETGQNGRPALRPFRFDAQSSAIGRHYLEMADSAQRISQPYVRRSWLQRGPLAGSGVLRGQEAFVPVDWSTVNRLIADELRRVPENYGNQAVFGGSYGWASAGRFHHAQSQLKRLLNLTGGFTSSVNTYSYGAAGVLLPHLLGQNHKDACDTAPSWNDIAAGCRLLVSFGGFRLSNAQVEAGGTGSHRVGQWLNHAAQQGVHIIIFSPTASDVPAGYPAEHIAIRPNTDSAVMLALAYCQLQQNRVDRAAVERISDGLPVLQAYLYGKRDGVVKDAHWAAQISGVPAARIEQLAGQLTTQPSLINLAWSLQRARYGEQPYWAAIALGCLSGHLGKKGCGFAFGLSAVNSVGQPVRRLTGPSMPQGTNPVKDFIPVARICELLERPGTKLAYNGITLTLPKIELIWWCGGNPFHHHQDLTRLRHAFSQPQTVIVSDSMWTATAKMADIVLPSALPFERNDIAASSRDNWLVYSRQVQPPPENIRSDYQAFCGIAAELGLEQAFSAGRDEAAWLEYLYRGYQQQHAELPDWADFTRTGFAVLDPGQCAAHPADHFARFVADPARHPLSTESGRIQIASARLAGFGYADLPGHPCWLPPEEYLGAPLARRYPLHLLSPQPATRLHSQLGPVGLSAQDKINGLEKVQISVTDAQAYHIEQHQAVEIYNDRGRLWACAQIDDGLMPGVLILPTGAWYQPDDNETDCGGNPNTLTSIRPSSTLSQATAPNSCLVAIRGRPVVQVGHD